MLRTVCAGEPDRIARAALEGTDAFLAGAAITDCCLREADERRAWEIAYITIEALKQPEVARKRQGA